MFRRMLIGEDRLKRGKLNSAHGRDGQDKFGAASGWSHEVGAMVPPARGLGGIQLSSPLFTVAGQGLAVSALAERDGGELRQRVINRVADQPMRSRARSLA